MTIVTPFPIRRPPPADCQRTTCDAGRRASTLPTGRGTYSTSSGCPRAASHEPDADGDNRSAVPGQATVANPALALTGESTPLAGWNAGIFSSLLPGESAPHLGRSGPLGLGTGSNSLSARNAPNTAARNSRGQCVLHCANPKRSRGRRATYIPRPALAAAICVSWTIALVAGVVLIGALI